MNLSVRAPIQAQNKIDKPKIDRVHATREFIRMLQIGSRVRTTDCVVFGTVTNIERHYVTVQFDVTGVERLGPNILVSTTHLAPGSIVYQHGHSSKGIVSKMEDSETITIRYSKPGKDTEITFTRPVVLVLSQTPYRKSRSPVGVASNVPSSAPLAAPVAAPVASAPAAAATPSAPVDAPAIQRQMIIKRIEALGFRVPLAGKLWVSRDCFTPGEREEIRTQWLNTERADWENTLKAQALLDEGPYVAVGCGRILGYYDNREDAIEASSNAIEAVVGSIGVSFTQCHVSKPVLAPEAAPVAAPVASAATPSSPVVAAQTAAEVPLVVDILPTEMARLNAHLAPFDLTSTILQSLLRDTSAVLAGGAVVHLLSGVETPLSAESDLDFWIYDPSKHEWGVKLPADSDFPRNDDNCHHSRVFERFVGERFLKALPAWSFSEDIGKTRMKDTLDDYMSLRGEFKTRFGTNIRVRWLFNSTTKRLINVIFTDQPIWNTIQGFDIPLCRAALYGNCKRLSLRIEPVVLHDFADRKLTPPNTDSIRTAKRVTKYCDRYGLRMRMTAEVALKEELLVTWLYHSFSRRKRMCK